MREIYDQYFMQSYLGINQKDFLIFKEKSEDFEIFILWFNLIYLGGEEEDYSTMDNGVIKGDPAVYNSIVDVNSKWYNQHY
jgi:hypothetical protein